MVAARNDIKHQTDKNQAVKHQLVKNQAARQQIVQGQISEAIAACEEKQAQELTILELEQGAGAFTDYFVMCSGTNPRQIQAIADGVDERLENIGLRAAHTEGYKQAEWVLLDYVDFVVHIFSEKARQFYDLERLWKSAKRIEPAELLAKPGKTRSRTSSAAPRGNTRKTRA